MLDYPDNWYFFKNIHELVDFIIDMQRANGQATVSVWKSMRAIFEKNPEEFYTTEGDNITLTQATIHLLNAIDSKVMQDDETHEIILEMNIDGLFPEDLDNKKDPTLPPSLMDVVNHMRYMKNWRWSDFTERTGVTHPTMNFSLKRRLMPSTLKKISNGFGVPVSILNDYQSKYLNALRERDGEV